MKTHEEIYPQLNAYLRHELSGAAQIAVAEHLAVCEICQTRVGELEKTRDLLKNASEKKLQPAGRLRLYEKLNEERRQRGEKLLKIPAELIAQVKAKGEAMAEAAEDVVAAGGESASRTLARSGDVVKTMHEGAKSVSEEASGAGKTSIGHGKAMVDEAGRTMLDTGRTLTSEVADVVGDTLEHPIKAVVAPARLAGKGVKAGVRMVKGSAKIAASGVKGALSAVKGGRKVLAESVRQGGETADSMADLAETMLDEGQQVAGALGEGVQKVKDAQPEEDEA